MSPNGALSLREVQVVNYYNIPQSAPSPSGRGLG